MRLRRVDCKQPVVGEAADVAEVVEEGERGAGTVRERTGVGDAIAPNTT